MNDLTETRNRGRGGRFPARPLSAAPARRNRNRPSRRDIPNAPLVAVVLLLAGTLLGPSLAFSATLAVHQTGRTYDHTNGVPYNLLSRRGVPISETPDQPPGSDGRWPTDIDQTAAQLTTARPTAGQFQSVFTFGLSFGTVDTSATSAAPQNARVRLMATHLGAPIIARPVSFKFGQTVPPPSHDENGNVLPSGEAPADYWFAEPHDSEIAGNRYYWSPHAGQVFATQPGPMSVVWRKRGAVTTRPADTNGWLEISGSWFRLFTTNYVVSGSAIKAPRRIYWTKGGYSGPPVDVPGDRINDVNIVFNSDVPALVSVAEAEANRRNGSTEPAFTNTLGFVRQTGLNQMHAMNREGRVFVELLGDVRDGNARRVHLGFEIVDIVREPVAADVTVELGERVTAYGDGRDESDLTAPAVLGSRFLHRQVNGEQVTIYAQRETGNLNDALIHWLEPGEQGIRWPARFVRYRLRWPTDDTRFSHYLRPAAENPDEAKETAVPLPREQQTEIAFQDELPSPFGAYTTADYRFYTHLNSAHPTHRTLLKHTTENDVAFERVLSQLAANVVAIGGSEPAFDIQRDLAAVRSGPGLIAAGSRVLRLPGPGQVALPPGMPFNSGSFTVEAWVNLRARSDFARLAQLTIQTENQVVTMAAGLGLDQGRHTPYLDIHGTALTGSETANLNAENSAGGLRYTVDIMPLRPEGTNLSNWEAVIIGAANQSTSLTSSNPHFGFLIDGSGEVQPWDGVDRGLTSKNFFFRPMGDYRGQFLHVELLATDTNDANPFNGSGETRIELFREGSSSAAFNYPKGDGGYVNNIYSTQSGRSPGQPGGQIANLRVTRISDGSGFALSTNELPQNQWVHVAMVGDATECRIYLNGALAGAGPNPATVAGTLQSGQLGSDGASRFTDASFDDFRIWSRVLSAEEIQTRSTTAPVDRSRLGLEWNFDLATAADSSGNNRNGTVTGGTIEVDDSSPGVVSGGARDRLPRLVRQRVNVGDRILPPAGETGAAGDSGYVGGSIRLGPGLSDHYSAPAYADPFVVGFTNANVKSIIPVNSVPGTNTLEVWWFRTNRVDLNRGFRTIHWPSIVGRYTIQWPAAAREIVLASNDGSGPLDSLLAKGNIYVQNDIGRPGYNPNEEHALMSGGQAFALRDDLNITGTQNTGLGAYSSEPYVLLEFADADGRPSVEAFHVLREKPEDGLTFRFSVTAGTILQPPMPLPLLDAPVVISNQIPISLNTEVADGWTVGSSDSSDGTQVRLAMMERFVPGGTHKSLALEDAGGTANRFFYVTNFSTTANTLSGVVSDTPARDVQDYNLSDDYIKVPGDLGHQRTDDVILVTNERTRQSVLFDVFNSIFNEGTGTTTIYLRPRDRLTDLVDAHGSAPLKYVLPAGGLTNDYFRGWTLWLNQRPAGIVDTNLQTRFQGFTFQDRKNSIWVYRGPHARSDTGNLMMQFYYGTLPGFNFPHLPLQEQPTNGTLTPYLRVRNEDGTFVGEPIRGPGSEDALGIDHVPVWPGEVPVLQMGRTHTLPADGLPAIRGQKSLEALYQQSQVVNESLARRSVILHDSTREKVYSLTTEGLAKLPGSARTSDFRGKTYFPSLPPHLSERFFFDPNRGSKGSLVLPGRFIDEAVGDDFLWLNVLTTNEVSELKDLVLPADENKGAWDTAIDGLSTELELFVEQTGQPGTFVPSPNDTVQKGPRDICEILNDDVAVDSYALTAVGPGTGYVTLVANNGRAFTADGDPVSLLILRVTNSLYGGEIKIARSSNPLSEKVTLHQVIDLAGQADDFEFDWRIAAPVDGGPPAFDSRAGADLDSRWTSVTADGVRYVLGGRPGIRTLIDNYFTVRYRARSPNHASRRDATGNPIAGWSDWADPALAEGWIKRVLAGINPFNQRVNDLFNNSVNTTASILSQAGARWEGDVALNLDVINEYGLIQIYETILNRGRSFSIDADINYGPANDALLLAAGYINDLYMLLGNEALADAANPTIGIGSKAGALGDIATALFAFKGQMPTLLAEELALLRGRDMFQQPGVEVRPVYNRLFWNYTRGIDAGEVIYALNYNITEDANQNPDGVVNADDARRLYPQGHGDAYGHYLTALKGYYQLLIDTNFTWVPRIEAVNILGKPVAVDYLDERKFAAAAAALARAGRQIFDLSWRQDFKSGGTNGWSHFSPTREKTSQGIPTTRHWGLDHWASRVGQGSYVNWLAGNSMLPEVDPDPDHEGIQKIDRTTVPELDELTTVGRDLQTRMEHAEAHLNPLGLSETSIPFDIQPSGGLATGNSTHFEQVYERAVRALRNAVTAFDAAKDVTRQMRSEENSLNDFQASVAGEELAFSNSLIELYGSPYPDDIGPGKTFQTGFEGPDLIHYMYVETPAVNTAVVQPTESKTFSIDIQNYTTQWNAGPKDGFAFIVKAAQSPENGLNGENLQNSVVYAPGQHFVEFTLDRHGFFQKPLNWSGKRASPGDLQQAISEIIAARNAALAALEQHAALKYELDRKIEVFEAGLFTAGETRAIKQQLETAKSILEFAKFANEMFELGTELAEDKLLSVQEVLAIALPTVVGLSTDVFAPARAAIKGGKVTTETVFDAVTFARKFAFGAYEVGVNEGERWRTFHDIEPLELAQANKEAVFDLDMKLGDLQLSVITINHALQKLDDAQRKYQATLAKAQRVQQERETFRKRSAALVQGYRTRDAAFRIFRNEKLERYQTLLDLAARYAFLTAQAYDYETGLLHTPAGRRFIEKIVQARALGVVAGGEPQFAGSDTGDPGLSSALAEMKADWDVLKGRLGFNNPDVYGTTFSLRLENYRLLPGTEGDTRWQDTLQRGRRDNLLEDEDVQRYCMQISRGEGLPVPGIVLEFDTTITPGFNFFGEPLAAGDHKFGSASFANKIFSVGIALEGYRGMDNPAANTGATGGTSPGDPSVPFLDPLALSATPYVYLIPVGVDAMRSPPLGDQSVIRTWKVDDVIVPMPFNIGGSDFSSQPFYQSADSLSEPLLGIRKHQSFRPVSDAGVYAGDNGRLFPSTYTNTRLVGRSVWNTRWKLIIPGHELLSDPDEGLRRLIETVTDIKLHLETYSYSGN